MQQAVIGRWSLVVSRWHQSSIARISLSYQSLVAALIVRKNALPLARIENGCRQLLTTHDQQLTTQLTTKS
jgi:hypothetical protein